MAQGVRRPGRHSRQTSRIANLVTGRSADHANRVPHVADEATVDYIKRILCNRKTSQETASDPASDVLDQQRLDELLPPLTSSNAIDVQLYALIAVVLDLFVQAWYSKITPDQDFVREVVAIIAHCTRGLEQRLRDVDLVSLLIDELPAVIDAHVTVVEIANTNIRVPGQGSTARVIYHTIRPHNALTPVPFSPEQLAEQQTNESAWCQMLVNRVLSLVLPPEDLENPCLYVLVSEVLSEMIFHNGICGKASESWLIWEGVTKIIYSIRPDLARPQQPDLPQIDRLEQFGLLSRVRSRANSVGQKTRSPAIDTFVRGFWAALQTASLLWIFMRSFALAWMQASSLPARVDSSQAVKVESKSAAGRLVGANNMLEAHLKPPELYPGDAETTPILGMSIWNCVSTITHLQQRMPWLTGFLSLVQWLLLFGPGQVCCTNSRLDRLLAHSIRSRLLDPAALPSALQAIRTAIFPDNALGPARVPPTSDESLAIKQECARVVIEAVPEYVRSRFFATSDVALMRQDVEGMLDLFADSYINKHLIVSIVELLAMRLFPEMQES